MSNYENESAETVICPHCGEDHGEDLEEGRLTCESCGNSFRLRVERTVTYTTRCVGHTFRDGWKQDMQCPEWETRRCEVCDELEVREIKRGET